MSDLIFHGRHPFPGAVEKLILQIHKANPTVWRELSGVAERWTRLPPSEESCRRVSDYLLRMLRDLERRGTQARPVPAG